jgi:hypothetical protein
MDSSEDVFKTIESGGVKMRPRWYFLVREALVIAAIVLLAFITLILASFIIFALKENGGWYAIRFGARGWSDFLDSLPWSILLLSLALILILAFLLKQYAFAYHRPFLYLLLLLVAVVSLAGFFIAATSFHSGIFRYASANRIPLIPGVYRFEMTPSGDLYRGEVITFLVSGGGIVIENALGETSTVILTPAASSELEGMDSGDYVIVFGWPGTTDTIDASGLERAPSF